MRNTLLREISETYAYKSTRNEKIAANKIRSNTIN